MTGVKQSLEYICAPVEQNHHQLLVFLESNVWNIKAPVKKCSQTATERLQRSSVLLSRATESKHFQTQTYSTFKTVLLSDHRSALQLWIIHVCTLQHSESMTCIQAWTTQTWFSHRVFETWKGFDIFEAAAPSAHFQCCCCFFPSEGFSSVYQEMLEIIMSLFLSARQETCLNSTVDS